MHKNLLVFCIMQFIGVLICAVTSHKCCQFCLELSQKSLADSVKEYGSITASRVTFKRTVG